jgi:hypothetical protein
MAATLKGTGFFGCRVDIAITDPSGVHAVFTFRLFLITFDTSYSGWLSVWDLEKCEQGISVIERGSLNQRHLHVMHLVRVFGFPFLPLRDRELSFQIVYRRL